MEAHENAILRTTDNVCFHRANLILAHTHVLCLKFFCSTRSIVDKKVETAGCFSFIVSIQVTKSPMTLNTGPVYISN